jgi:hypothetical protein
MTLILRDLTGPANDSSGYAFVHFCYILCPEGFPVFQSTDAI